MPTRAGIDSDFDTGSDRDRTDRTDRHHCLEERAFSDGRPVL
ncbi:MAG: hypothetical protein ACOX52_22435 [Verrucomicrobiota bacterium]